MNVDETLNALRLFTAKYTLYTRTVTSLIFYP